MGELSSSIIYGSAVTQALAEATAEAKRERERADFFAQLAGQRFSEFESVDHRRKFWCDRFAQVWPHEPPAEAAKYADFALAEYDKRWREPQDAPREKP
jgi:hypothetical protein